jgi:glycosyltransferase involved in cell wall biosynthesis
MYRVLKIAERLTYASADLVISANETFRKIAVARGGRKPENVVAVYSVPDKARMRRVAPDPALRGGAGIVLGYVGIIGDQDGVDHLIRAFAHLRAQGAGEGVRAVIVGDGTALPEVQRLAGELGLGDHVTFTGYLRGEDLLAALSTFDIGVIPDPVNECNDKLSMNKVFEYSAFGIPSVSYPLSETMNLLGATGTYSVDATPEGLGEAIMTLIRDDDLRQTRSAEAKALADRKFDWSHEASNYVTAYNGLRSPTQQPGMVLAERS